MNGIMEGREEDVLLQTKSDREITLNNHRMEKLEEQIRFIKDTLYEIRIQDQQILRTLLENYRKFLSRYEERRGSSLKRQFSTPLAGTNLRLETVRSILGQRGTLNIRQISDRLFPPGRKRLESEPIYYVSRLTSSLSFEETFEGVFSDDDETILDPLSTSSFT